MAKTKSNAIDQVLTFFNKRNRPYSVQDISSAFQNELNKSTVQKAIDQLVEDGRLLEKPFGKSKIYFLDQKAMTEVGADEIRQLDQELDKAKRELDELKSALKTKEALYVSLTAGMSLDDLEAQLKGHEKKLAEMLEKTKKMQSGDSIKKKDKLDEKENVRDMHKKLTSETRKRKRIAVDIVESILEGYPKSKKMLLEEIGIETFT
jgi:26S proteasome regulatory subunit (ATPase 3-interacting protein)